MTVRRILSLIIILSICFLLAYGCSFFDDIIDSLSPGGSSTDKNPGGKDKNKEDAISDEELFDTIIDEIFADWVSADTLTMNFFLADPDSMGIDRPEPGYGSIMTPQQFAEERNETAELKQQLARLDYNALREDQKVTYDILDRILDLSEILEMEDDFLYYSGYIRPLNGIQVQLPILLAEYNFYTADDIELYLLLLEDTIRYFSDIIDFERERAQRGFFMSEANADKVIEQIESFLLSREDNLLIVIFNDRIDKYEGLTEQQREEFKERNRVLVLENVLVAYDNLLAAMFSLRGVGANPGGYAALPRGDEFAYATLCLRAGTDRSVSEIENLIEMWRITTLENVRRILRSDSALNRKYLTHTTGQIATKTPEEFLLLLRDTMMHDFPAVEPIEHVIMEVHDSLSDFTAPAFFLVPAVDVYDNNVIYINHSSIEDNLTLLTALAHEGYPGHMYQMVHLRQQSPHPIRIMLSNMGYTEGWAMYVELLSYQYAGLDPLEVELLCELRLYFLLLQSHADIGVNLLGWDRDDVAALLFMDLGTTDDTTIDNFYNAVTGVPVNTIIYTLGFIELYLLQAEYENVLQGDASTLGFHTFFLDFGPAPYSIMRRALYL